MSPQSSPEVGDSVSDPKVGTDAGDIGALVVTISVQFTPAVPPTLANMQDARRDRANPCGGSTVTKPQQEETVYSD